MILRHYFVLAGLIIIGISGCGTMASISSTKDYVQYASISVTDSLNVSGRLLNNNDLSITISVDGAIMEYIHRDIIGYQKYMSANPELMQRDILKNTQKTANNTGFFVGLTIISFAFALISLVI
jgi:uncharacterized protein YceK